MARPASCAAGARPPGGVARELSDPGAEPPAYELFSAFMLELIGEADPHAMGPRWPGSAVRPTATRST